MIEYKGQLNLGNEAFGTEKTITANESLRTCDAKALAREIHHQNGLIPEDVAASVLAYFCKAACEKMAEGFAIQLYNGDDVAIRIFPDIHVKGGNINLKRAKELDPTVAELTLENAGELIDKAGGVTVRVRAVVQQKFTDLLNAEGIRVQRTGIIEAPYVARKSEDEEETEQSANGGENGNTNINGGTGTINNGGQTGDNSGDNGGGGDNGNEGDAN